MRKVITREEAREMSDAHGSHEDAPREGCPDCERRELSSYPLHSQVVRDSAYNLAAGITTGEARCPDCGQTLKGKP